MKITLSETISIYEIIAIVLSIIAFLQPFIVWCFKKFLIKAEVKYYINGQATLFYNKSGPYMRLDGVLEAKRKKITVKKIFISIKNKSNNKILNLVWSSLISPINQNIVGSYVQTTEKAHPFYVESDTLSSAFVEFAQPDNQFSKQFNNEVGNLFESIPSLLSMNSSFDDALETYRNNTMYSKMVSWLENELFWKIGKYSIDICIIYDEGKKYNKSYEFSVTEKEYNELKSNIDEILINPFKQAYQRRFNFYAPVVDLIEI